MQQNQRAMASLMGAYLLWTTLPLYLKLFAKSVPLEIAAHRLLWSFLFLLLFFVFFKKQTFQKQYKKIKKSTLFFLFLSGLMIFINWLFYIYAVHTNELLQASLGYFITPILSVFMGLVLLREKIHPLQWVSIFLATVGVGYLIFFYGKLPWLALGMASTFGVYSLLQKKITLESSFSLFLEMAFLVPITLAYFVFIYLQGSLSFLTISWQYDLGLVFLGILTILPLVFFGYSIKWVTFTLLGFVQFYLPTAIFFIGVFLFKEEFSLQYQITFVFIWLAVVTFIIGGYRSYHKKKRLASF